MMYSVNDFLIQNEVFRGNYHNITNLNDKPFMLLFEQVIFLEESRFMTSPQKSKPIFYVW